MNRRRRLPLRRPLLIRRCRQRGDLKIGADRGQASDRLLFRRL